MAPESVFTNIRIQEIQHGDEENTWEVFLEEGGKRFALSKSGSGLKTVILILINLYIIPNLSKYKNKKSFMLLRKLKTISIQLSKEEFLNTCMIMLKSMIPGYF